MAHLESLVVTGDLILLDAEQRTQFYIQVCEAHGLNPRTRPLQYFEQIDRNGKRNLILYALRGASAQFSKLHNLSSSIVNQNPTFERDIAVFEATIKSPDGRTETASGVTSLKGLSGKEYADAIMAAQTKAKRRAILDFVGSGMLDESEVEGMRGSVVEVTDADLAGYVPIPAVPVVVAPAPSVEVVLAPLPPTSTAPITFTEYGRTFEAAVPPPFEPPPLPPPFVLEAPPSKDEMEKIFARLGIYRRDVLQRGGMRPSKGFGIAAKWEKYVRKYAPNKTIEEYKMLLGDLDVVLKNQGDAAVVNAIEKEIRA